MNIYRLVIGDWSHDGHNRTDEFIFEVSHDIKEIQDAYRRFVEKSSVAFSSSEGHSADKLGIRKVKAKHVICDEYQDSVIEKEVVQILLNEGLDLEFRDSEFTENGDWCVSPTDLAYLFMEMVKSQLEGFTYKIKKIPSINGFWGDLNIAIGYGVYE